MTIQTRDWDIGIETTPGAQGLKVSGVVTVPTPAHRPVLVQASEHNDATLELKLIVEVDCGIVAQVETDKPVSFFEPGEMKYNSVYVYYQDDLLFGLTDFLMRP